MHDGVKNSYSFEINGISVTLVSLIPQQIYKEQLKMKRGKVIENESLYTKGTFFC